MQQFAEHNKHWQSLEIFEEQDTHLNALKQQELIHEPDFIYDFPRFEPGIYTLSGGRQIGKTTLLKQWMRYLLIEEKAFKASDIFFITGEIISDHISLIQLINQYLVDEASENLRILIVDEVSYIKNWDQGIKYLADLGRFRNVILILTGSDSVFIKEARMRFPGRGGKASKREFHLYPLSFYDFIQLKYKDIKNLDSGLLFKEFNFYLIHGGFLTAINDYAKYQKISLATYSTYSDWVRGDFLKRGKSEAYLREVLRAIIKTYGTQVTWNALADHTSINHHDTVREYVELLQSMDVLFIQYALLEDKLAAAPKKAKKIIFKDPFMYYALRRWVFPDQLENPEIIPCLVESCVVSQYTRFYDSCYYIKAEGEVDLAYIHNDRFWPIEVKWRNQDRPKDLKQILKYKNGLILNKFEEEDIINHTPTQPLPTHLYYSYEREKFEQCKNEMPDRERLEKISNAERVLRNDKIKTIEKNLKRKSLSWDEAKPANGFSYAFGLTESKKYIQIATKYYEETGDKHSYHASPVFVSFLLKQKILREIKEPKQNVLIMYFDAEDNPTHAGIIKLCDSSGVQLVESKWGTIVALFHHGVLEVPKSYGGIVRYYAVPDLKIIEESFEEFCSIIFEKNNASEIEFLDKKFKGKKH